MKIEKTPSPNDLRLFFLGVTGGFSLIIWGIPYLKYQRFEFSVLFPLIGFVLIGLLFPEKMQKPRTWWIKFGEVLGHVNGVIIFTVLYFTLFLLISLLFKIFNRDRLKLNFKQYNSLKQAKRSISPMVNMF